MFCLAKLDPRLSRPYDLTVRNGRYPSLTFSPIIPNLWIIFEEDDMERKLNIMDENFIRRLRRLFFSFSLRSPRLFLEEISS
ncbi:MAG: hypothetical protein CL608_07900 [Anaerolineaceae bacterium]|nr:hypothetical protein [Anaerolineaceae bacterium]